MDKGTEYTEPFIQVAVVDGGIGVLDALRESHKDIETPEVALERSLWPYFSGKFSSFQTGSAQNAGMGLFFVSEMAKLTSGKLLIASKGASLLIQGDPQFAGNNRIELMKTGFDGTMVAFEMPKRGTADYDELIKRIVEIAAERRQKKEIQHWVRYDIPREETLEFVISVASENTVKAEAFASNELLPRIEAKQPIVLNFADMKVCTQSYMHALIFQVIRRAYELQVPVYAKKVSPSVRDGIRLVEMYAL